MFDPRPYLNIRSLASDLTASREAGRHVTMSLDLASFEAFPAGLLELELNPSMCPRFSSASTIGLNFLSTCGKQLFPFCDSFLSTHCSNLDSLSYGLRSHSPGRKGRRSQKKHVANWCCEHVNFNRGMSHERDKPYMSLTLARQSLALSAAFLDSRAWGSWSKKNWSETADEPLGLITSERFLSAFST